MDFYSLAKERFSVCKFQDRPVEKEKVDRMLEAGRVAPTAKNLQPFQVYVLKSEEALAKIRALTPATFQAPVVMLLCEDIEHAWVNPFDEFNSSAMDLAIMTSHMMLQAQELGLGTTWVCWFDTAKVKEAFNIPEQYQPRVLLPVGYPAEDVKPGPLHAERKALSDYVTEL